MVRKTEVPVRTARQDATRILTADHREVSRIFAEFEKVKDEPEQSPAPKRQGNSQRSA